MQVTVETMGTLLTDSYSDVRAFFRRLSLSLPWE